MIATLAATLMLHKCKELPKGTIVTERVLWETIVEAGKEVTLELSRAKLLAISWGESKYKIDAQNPKSSAYGLWGFLDSTRKTYNVPKNRCTYCQTLGALRYIKSRYRTVDEAYKHFIRKGWY